MSDPAVRPFAFMRLTHEALRAGFASLRALAEAGDVAAAEAAWPAFLAVIELHKRQEEESFFPLLDERFDGAVARAGLRDAHRREEGFEAAVAAALATGEAAALADALARWAPSFEAHLVAEEDVMMPLTQRVAPTLEGRAEAVRAIMAVDWEALAEVQLPYIVRSLAAARPYEMLRAFVGAVRVAAGDRYAALEPAIRGALPAEVVARLADHGQLGADA